MKTKVFLIMVAAGMIFFGGAKKSYAVYCSQCYNFYDGCLKEGKAKTICEKDRSVCYNSAGGCDGNAASSASAPSSSDDTGFNIDLGGIGVGYSSENGFSLNLGATGSFGSNDSANSANPANPAGGGGDNYGGNTSQNQAGGIITPKCGTNGQFKEIGGVCFPVNTGLSSAPIYLILSNIFSWLMGIFTTIAIIAFVISGIQYLVSSGDQDMLETAKRNSKFALIGIVVGLSGFVVIRAIAAALSGGGYFF